MKERKLGLIGRKVGMTQIFRDDGECLGVTVLELGPCRIMGRRTADKDGYNALVLGFGVLEARKLNSSQKGALQSIGGDDNARRHLVELRVSAEVAQQFEPGKDVSLADVPFEIGQKVDVMGTSKGKGFQGVMKRHHFGGFRATHGTHEYFRHGGSIGCRKWPGRVYKGRKMPGHMGDERVTTQNVRVAAVRAEENLLLLTGSVPGAKNGLVTVRPAIKTRESK
jgi:large subunit ribosomal protein L3